MSGVQLLFIKVKINKILHIGNKQWFSFFYRSTCSYEYCPANFFIQANDPTPFIWLNQLGGKEKEVVFKRSVRYTSPYLWSEGNLEHMDNRSIPSFNLSRNFVGFIHINPITAPLALL